MLNRWGKLDKDFRGKDGKFDISKIPDIYDSVKYDLQHNQYTIQFPQTPELYTLAKAMADIVIPQEYGLTAQEKLTIGEWWIMKSNQMMFSGFKHRLQVWLYEDGRTWCPEVAWQFQTPIRFPGVNLGLIQE